MAGRPPARRIAEASLALGAGGVACLGAATLAARSLPTGIGVGLLLTGLAGWAVDAFVPGLGRGVITRGPPARPGLPPRVALTFDDGPAPDTPAVLDALARHGIHATFFMLGAHAARHPALVQEVASRGHAIGNHTYSHAVLALCGPRRIADELDRTQRVLVEAGAPRPRLFRAPRGFQGPLVRRELRRRGLVLVGWTRGAWDSERRGAREIAKAAAAAPRDGDILLLHDGAGTPGETRRDRTAEAIPLIVEAYRRRGFAFVTVPELLGEAVHE